MLIRGRAARPGLVTSGIRVGRVGRVGRVARCRPGRPGRQVPVPVPP